MWGTAPFAVRFRGIHDSRHGAGVTYRRERTVATQTECGRWTIHWADTCEHTGCPWGDVLTDNDSGRYYDAGAWTRDDWHDFCGDDFARECVVEMMTEVDRFGQAVTA